MVGVHHREEEVRRPVGLEERHMPELSVLGDLVLIAVDEIGVRMPYDFRRKLLKGIVFNRVIAVHEHDEITGGFLKPCIGRLGYAAVFLPENHFDMIVF